MELRHCREVTGPLGVFGASAPILVWAGSEERPDHSHDSRVRRRSIVQHGDQRPLVHSCAGMGQTKPHDVSHLHIIGITHRQAC